MQRFPSFHRNPSSIGIRTAREHLSDILNRHYTASAAAVQKEKPDEPDPRQKRDGENLSLKAKSEKKKTMSSSKGKPTDPRMREEVKEEVKSEEKGERYLIHILAHIAYEVEEILRWHASLFFVGVLGSPNNFCTSLCPSSKTSSPPSPHAHSNANLFFFSPLGGGAGSWSAWKAGEMARRYEAKGGDYEDTEENKNKAQKGAPEKK